MVEPRHFNLAIETSSRYGSVTLGRDDELLGSDEIPAPDRSREHRLDLIPTIDRLCRRYGTGPGGLGQVYVSIGPGSFTGLRNAVTTARMLALTIGARIAAVPTARVVLANVPDGRDQVAVCLSSRPDRSYCTIYRREGGNWQVLLGPDWMSPGHLCEEVGRPLAVLGDHLPRFEWPSDVECLDQALATPRSEQLWRLGRASSHRGDFADPQLLLPLYGRAPEPVELWEQRHGQQDGRDAPSPKS